MSRACVGPLSCSPTSALSAAVETRPREHSSLALSVSWDGPVGSAVTKARSAVSAGGALTLRATCRHVGTERHEGRTSWTEGLSCWNVDL